MTFKPAALFRGMLTSLFVSSGILAIANVDRMLMDQGQSQELTREKVRLAKDRFRQRLEAVSDQAEKKPSKPRGLVNMLRDSLAQDEFHEELPFANLSTLDPLTRLFENGVAHFERTVFRSPDYQGESGYDLVQYDIEHPDGTHSAILAYLDRPQLTVSRNVGTADPRIPVVMILEAQGLESTYSLYRSGNLIERSQIPTSDVSALVAQRISLSIPFMSVSR
jgi:hypothetical protein